MARLFFKPGAVFPDGLPGSFIRKDARVQGPDSAWLRFDRMDGTMAFIIVKNTMAIHYLHLHPLSVFNTIRTYKIIYGKAKKSCHAFYFIPGYGNSAFPMAAMSAKLA
jgi:hypothetical protein